MRQPLNHFKLQYMILCSVLLIRIGVLELESTIHYEKHASLAFVFSFLKKECKEACEILQSYGCFATSPTLLFI